jgi:hypothetical protein
VAALDAEHQPQLLLQQVGAVQRPVHLGDPRELAALAAGQVLGVLPQREPGVLEFLGDRGLPGAAGGVPGLAADLVQRVGGPLHDVEGVQAQHRLRAAARRHDGDPAGRVRAQVG